MSTMDPCYYHGECTSLSFALVRRNERFALYDSQYLRRVVVMRGTKISTDMDAEAEKPVSVVMMRFQAAVL
ncbi:hypothetical protein KIN20_020495 [Parelaphostrongylus tenuis]|uniref:Uncharacterized protein n=1 Tax=Parelaphostrongylus tenuis TaxID=148309 RepID=A0AAD5N6L9_PARTN|nr:hypothetical protein KIN20_020495 [Parelaphostrongylus tenuis]